MKVYGLEDDEMFEEFYELDTKNWQYKLKANLQKPKVVVPCLKSNLPKACLTKPSSNKLYKLLRPKLTSVPFSESLEKDAKTRSNLAAISGEDEEKVPQIPSIFKNRWKNKLKELINNFQS